METKLLELFTINSYKIQVKKIKIRLEKLLKRKDNQLYVRWKSYDNSLSSWIDIKDIVI